MGATQGGIGGGGGGERRGGGGGGGGEEFVRGEILGHCHGQSHVELRHAQRFFFYSKKSHRKFYIVNIRGH
jgi:hypothetical protein